MCKPQPLSPPEATDVGGPDPDRMPPCENCPHLCRCEITKLESGRITRRTQTIFICLAEPDDDCPAIQEAIKEMLHPGGGIQTCPVCGRSVCVGMNCPWCALRELVGEPTSAKSGTEVGL